MGVITSFITGRGPPCIIGCDVMFQRFVAFFNPPPGNLTKKQFDTIYHLSIKSYIYICNSCKYGEITPAKPIYKAIYRG